MLYVVHASDPRSHWFVCFHLCFLKKRELPHAKVFFHLDCILCRNSIGLGICLLTCSMPDAAPEGFQGNHSVVWHPYQTHMAPGSHIWYVEGGGAFQPSRPSGLSVGITDAVRHNGCQTRNTLRAHLCPQDATSRADRTHGSADPRVCSRPDLSVLPT